MAAQPPARPWFRLGSIVRPGTAIPTPTPEPTPQPVAPPPAPAQSPTPTAAPTAVAAASVPTPTPAPAPAPAPIAAVFAPAPAPAPAAAPAPALIRPTLVRPLAPLPGPTGAARPVIIAAPPPPPPTVMAIPLSTTTATSSVPSSPIRTTLPPQTSPTRPAAASTVSARLPSPAQSPKTIPQTTSPRNKPPSPLILPSAQLRATATNADPPEAEQKVVLVQKTVEKPIKPSPWLASSAPAATAASMIKPKPEKKHSPPETEDSSGMRIITIAGDNRGAFMELITRPQGNKSEAGHADYRGTARFARSSDSGDSAASGEGKDAAKKEKSGKKSGKTKLPMTAFMNSNVQGINNSIMYNSSCTHHDPGVHLSLTTKPNGGGFLIKDRVDHK